ncbi:MAG: DUF433 domain-containing protein [Terrimicrobiaceae bacterium]
MDQYPSSMAIEALPHLHRDSNNAVWIDQTGYRVVDLVREHLAHGWSAESLHENHPDLSLAQIHASLAWFYDHEQDVLDEISTKSRMAEGIFALAGSHSVQDRIRALKASRPE